MGTSQSNPGLNNTCPLVPSWAEDPNAPQLTTPTELSTKRFNGFRRSLGSYVSNGESRYLRKALKHYAKTATGGGGVAAQRMSKMTTAGGVLFDTLTRQRTSGEHSIDITRLTGKPCDEAISEIVNSIVAVDADSDKVRAAMNEALCSALDGMETFDANHITKDILTKTMVYYLSESVFIFIVNDAGKSWNKVTMGEDDIQRENELRALIESVVERFMEPKLEDRAFSLSSSEIVAIEKEVIEEVWEEWENYQ